MDRRNIQRIWQPNLVERVAVAYISANKDAGVALARSNPRTNDDDLLDDRIYKQQTRTAHASWLDVLPILHGCLKGGELMIRCVNSSTARPTNEQDIGCELTNYYRSTIIRALQTLPHTIVAASSSEKRCLRAACVAKVMIATTTHDTPLG